MNSPSGDSVALSQTLWDRATNQGVNDRISGELETWLSQTNQVIRGFVKDHQIQLYFMKDGRYSMYKSAWKQSRAPAQGFSYATAELETAKPPKQMEPPSPRWHEVKVLSKSESEHLFRTAAKRFVPLQPGHGIHCRYALGDVVLFRDKGGQVQLRSGTDEPAGIAIDGRYTRQEIASTVTTALETDLRAEYPDLTGFVVTIGSGSRFRLAFVNLAERAVVVLYVPRENDEARNPAHLGFRLSNLASVILVDHVWTFLKNPISASTRTIHQVIQWPLTLVGPRLRPNRAAIPPLSHEAGMDLAAWEQWLDRHTRTPREQGALRLLIDGDHFYPLMERRVIEARSNINFHVCIFDQDDVAVEVADLLKQRSTNIEVKVVFDRLNTRSAARCPPATLMREDFVAPRSIAAYLENGSKVRVRPQPNPGLSVDHSKVYLIDGRYAYVGGMNLGREYRYEWHDMIAEVQGPAVASFQRQFDKKWGQVGLWGDCGLAAATVCQKSPANPEVQPDVKLIELRRLYTKTFDRQIRQAELAAINRASKYIDAENPYFYSSEVLVALARARSRGVDVRVVIPSENDTGAGHKSNLVVANYLLEHGARVFFYPGMTHVKALLVDGWACFGSANFDALSLRLLREADLATSDPAFAERLRNELFETDFARSRELREPLSLDWSDQLADALLTPF